MGLDMYLTKKTYVKNWDHDTADEKVSVIVRRGATVTKKNSHDVIVEGGRKLDIDESKISQIEEEAAYWRKANHIHNWFVQNVQNGNDNCGEYNVGLEKLQELVDLCQTVLNSIKVVDGQVKNGATLVNGEWQANMQDGTVISNPEVAAKLLPTSSGFFFGGTDYDQWYVEDLVDTVKQLSPYLEKDENGEYKSTGDFYYQSSW